MWYEIKQKQQKMPKARANINVYSSTIFSSLTFEDEMIRIPRTARYVIWFKAWTAEDAKSTSEHLRIQQYAIFRFNFWRWNDMHTTNCQESEKMQMSVYLIKREIKKKMLVCVPGTYISPLVVALEGGVNSNPSSRDRLFLRTANPRQDPNICVHDWHEACCRTQENRPGAWSSSVQTDARLWANHILPNPSINFRTG